MNQQPVDIGILTVIQVELSAMLEALGLKIEDKEKDADGAYSWLGTIYSLLTKRKYSLVVRVIGSPGNTDSAAAALALLKDVRPSVLMLVGIAAGIREKIKIGEVVLSEQVVAYESAVLEKTKKSKRKTIPRPVMSRIDYPLEQDVVAYVPNEAELLSAFEKIGGVFPSAKDGQEDDYKQFVASTIQSRQATIASGEKLLKDPTKLTTLRAGMHGRIEVGEMEAAGIAASCRRMSTPWLVVRGVSDFGDEFKSDEFHVFAAKTAAVVLADFIRKGLHLDYKRGAIPVSSEFSHLDDLFIRVSRLIRPASDAPKFDIRIGLASSFEHIRMGQFTVTNLRPDNIEELTRDNRLLIHAPGGSGKTAVMCEIAKHAIEANQLVFFLDLKTGSSAHSLTDSFTVDHLFELFSLAGNAESFHRAIDQNKKVLLLVDGLNEIYGPISDRVLTRIDRLLLDHPNVSLIIADRMNAHSDSLFSRATILPLAESEIRRLLPSGITLPHQHAELQLLSTPFFLDLQLSLWANMKAGSLNSQSVLARKEMFLRYFSESAEVADQDVKDLAKTAFLAYEKYRGRTFDPDWWNENTPHGIASRLDEAGVTVETVVGGERKKMFRHQLLHDFLTGYYVSELDEAGWTSKTFDAATFKANAAEPLSFAAELLGSEADNFLIRVYDWSYRTVDRCIADLKKALVSTPVSKDLELALLVKNAEKKFEVFEYTVSASERNLLEASLPEARLLNEAKSLDEVLKIVDSFFPSTDFFREWKKVFLMPRDSAVTEEELMLLDSNPILGWTAANSLRQVNLSILNLAQIRMMYHWAAKNKSESVRWRIVHVLGN